MQISIRTYLAAVAVAGFLFTLPQGLLADTVTQVALTSYYSGGWNEPVRSGAESGTGNTGTGLTFSDPNGDFVNVGPSNSVTIGSLSIALTSNSVVNSLLNTGMGDAPGTVEATVTFTNSNGATATYSLAANQTIRNYDNVGTQNINALSGSNTNPSDGDVTAQPWWTTGDAGTSGNGEPSQRLDAQTFVLPASWDGSNLASIVISDPSNDTPDLLSALQVDAKTPVTPPSVPEPASLLLLGAGLGAVALKVRVAR